MFSRLLERILAPIIDRRIEASREREANSPHQRELDRMRRARLAEMLDSRPAIADFDLLAARAEAYRQTAPQKQ